MSYQIIWKSKGIHISFKGSFTSADHTQTSNVLYSDPRIDHIQYIIRDLSGISEASVEMDDLTLPAAIDRGASHYLNTLKVALVATNEQTRNVCQMYIELSKRFHTHWHFQLFSSVGEAQRWASVPQCPSGITAL